MIWQCVIVGGVAGIIGSLIGLAAAFVVSTRPVLQHKRGDDLEDVERITRKES